MVQSTLQISYSVKSTARDSSLNSPYLGTLESDGEKSAKFGFLSAISFKVPIKAEKEIIRAQQKVP
jgi:hypothetical protein